MAMIDDLMARLVADATELITTLGIVTPLTAGSISHGLREIPETKRDVTQFMRWHLGKHVLLLISKLNEGRDDNGRTGATASIAAVIEHARDADRLSDRAARNFIDRLAALTTELRAEGVLLSSIRAFRTAEIAHSLHRPSTETDSTLLWGPIATFAHETYDLIQDIDAALGGTGRPDEFHLWFDRGEAFWQ